ncbi:IS21 family transposase [Microvirgula aerodenitrificans]|uniref:IS21 family transposase n=1 Tax=Pseudomonadota TaxID=1224 RepID=UPI0028E7C8AC|nr:IS21 family transposase [Microvirgula aerodenitrificans]
MPQQRMDIRMIKDILRLKYSAALSHEAIARSLGISKGVVAKYLGLAGVAGLDWATVAELDEAGLERRLLGRSMAETRVVEADFARVHIELRRKGVTLMLLWQEYRAAHEGRRTWAYTQFCEHYKAFAKTLKRSMRQQRRAGEKLFIDYAGPTLALADGSRAQIFVAAMGASSYTFACATADQSMRSWLGAMARALSFYGGCPQLIVPDNPRALVSGACRYEPKLNETVRDFARHYAVSILPARPFSPKDKATAESTVQVVTRWVLARLRHTVLFDVHAADAAVSGLLGSLNNRPFQKLDGSRASLFAALDSPALMPLPAQPWQWATFKTVKAHIDYHVEVEFHRYSVPHSLVGLELQARVTDALVEVLHRGQRVACHARSSRRGGFTTVDEHMPAAHRAHKQWTPERLIHWGAGIGPNTGQFVAQLLQRFKHPEHGYRSCLGLLSQAKHYGPARVEAACTLALELRAGHYRHVRDILANGRDLVARSEPAPEWVAPVHDNVRGAANYH